MEVNVATLITLLVITVFILYIAIRLIIITNLTKNKNKITILDNIVTVLTILIILVLVGFGIYFSSRKENLGDEFEGNAVLDIILGKSKQASNPPFEIDSIESIPNSVGPGRIDNSHLL